MKLVRVEYKELKRVNLLTIPMLMTLAVSYEPAKLIEQEDIQRMIQIIESNSQGECYVLDTDNYTKEELLIEVRKMSAEAFENLAKDIDFNIDLEESINRTQILLTERIKNA